MKGENIFKKKVGRPMVENPTHWHREEQREYRKFLLDMEWFRKFIIEEGLTPLGGYSFEELVDIAVHWGGEERPACFGAMGDWGLRPECKGCKEKDSTCGVEGFFDLEGGKMGLARWGIYRCCNIIAWVRLFQADVP